MNASCWANPLGGCPNQISREHTFSKGLFSGPTVRVSGLPWCREPKEIGLEALTAKILCTTHNSALSVLDSEAQKCFRSVQESWEISNAASRKFKIPELVAVFDVNALLLERWALKTLINLTVGSPYLIGPDGTSPGVPPASWVRVAFGQAPFPGEAGLYRAGSVGQKMAVGEDFAFAPLIKDDRYVLAGLFEFTGFTMMLWLHGTEVPTPLGKMGETIPGMSPAWATASLTRRFERIRFNCGPYLAAVIRMDR